MTDRSRSLPSRALDALIEKVEKRKFSKTGKPTRKPKLGAVPGRRIKGGRHIAARVRRAVEERDRGQCTFVSESGQRCEERRMLEFDHAKEVARGGVATVENIRLRCRAHNQYTAERTFGSVFMQDKRDAARRRSS